jgi:CIC family chloride channel protein
MNRWVLIIAAMVIGTINAVVFKVFEEIVKEGTDLIWNDWFNTDDERWLVIPLAVVLSIIFTIVLKLLRKPRWIKPETSLDLGSEHQEKPTLGRIGSILTVGATGLLAGASLGPEMPLTESSHAIGAYAKEKLGATKEAGSVLILSSIGALMVAFLASMVMILLPFLLVYQKTKRVTLGVAVPIVLAGLSSYGTLWLMDHHPVAFASIPAGPLADLGDYWAAVLVALAISLAAWLLIKMVKLLGSFTHRVDIRLPWYLTAAFFGLVLGSLYVIGGESIQFNGSAGTPMLLADYASYSAWGLLGLALAKLLATAWSKAAGYRGGLYFPSIFMGVAIGLWLGTLSSTLAGPGTMIGAIAAIFMALSIPDTADLQRHHYRAAAIVSFLFMAALLPAKLIPLALVAIVAAGVGNNLLIKLFPAKLRP